MRYAKRLRWIAALPLCIALQATAAEQQELAVSSGNSPLVLTILHLNDHHSHLDAEENMLELETAPGKREDILVSMGGFPRITAAVREREKQAANIIKIHSGDATTGDLYYTLTEGKADAELMNTVCFDTLTLGNHEFDNTDAGLKKFIGFLHADCCKTAILSANTILVTARPWRRRMRKIRCVLQ